MLHYFNAPYSDSVQERIRLIQSNREQLNSDNQSFRGDGAYETETWTLCKALRVTFRKITVSALPISMQ